MSRVLLLVLIKEVIIVRNLKRLRENKKMSQQKLASIINVSQQSIYKYENSLAEPDFGTLIELANYFNTSVDYLIGNTSINRKYENLNDEALSDNELQLVQEFRELPKNIQELIISFMAEYNKK